MNQVDLELRLKTEKADAQVAESAKRGRDLFEKKGFKLNIKTGDLPLGRITGDFEKFQGSLDAATARVLAFTATTTVVYGLATAFTRLFTDSVKLEKQLASIQSILQTSNSNLQKFSSELFKVANATGQSFDVAAEAASEFARQGLSVEETLKATNAALVFSKIAGADAAQAVENLTASINTFGNEALSYTDVVDTIVSLDNAFAISAAGIADGLKRVGSVASESGIQLKEIASLISVVQQVSARGAPVISNGLKTIFTRLGRSKVQESLNSIGVSTQDANGEFRSQIDILTDLSNRLDSLSDSQRAFILEQVAGVYQINTLQATLKSLNGEYSLFDKAVKVASDSSGNAAERLKILTNTTDANLQKLKNNVTQFLAETGKATVKPLLDNFVGIGNFILDAFNLGSASKEGEEKGFTIGSSILNGISAALTGPGTILIVATIGKLLGKVTKDAFSALQTLSGLKQASLVDSKTQESINEAIAQGNKGLVARLATTTSIVEKTDILNKLLSDIANKKGIAQVNQAVSVGLAANKKTVSPKVRAKGYMPNYALGNIPNSVPKTQEPIPPEIRREEKMDALGGRYKSGKVRQVPEGYMNDAELRTKIPGGGPNHWILPPLTQNGKPVKAGEDFREKAIRTKGIDPYQATGFIPNFAPALKKKVSSKTKPKNSKDQEEEEEFETIKIGETPGDRAKREFRIRKNTNIEPDDVIKIYPLNIEPVDLSQETKNLKKQEVKGSGFTKRGTAYENDVLNYFSSRKVNPINFNREGMFGGRTSAVDGYRISPNENQTLDLLEVKSGSFSKLSVANKFKRFIPENINKIPELESLYKENRKTPQDTISIRPYLAIPDKSKYKNDSKGFIPNFASRYTEARKQKRDELRASLFNIGDFAGGEIKNVNAQTEFNQARDKNPNVEFDDKINQVGFKVERIPIPDREFEAALRSKENNKEVTTKFENYAIDYLNTKGYSFKPGRDTLYGKENAAVDGYNIKQNFIELLEVKGGKWDAPDVNNKFGRFAPENLVDLGPQLVSKFFKEGNPDPNINDKIRIRNVLAIPNLTGGVFKSNINAKYPSADVKTIEKARQRTRPSGKKIPANMAWMLGVVEGMKESGATNASGFIPNFASVKSSPYVKSVMGLEERMSGKKAVLDYDSSLGPYIRNTGQRNLPNALADHGGLKNAMKDSVAGQQSAGLASKGFIPNFAAPPPSRLSIAKSPAKQESQAQARGFKERRKEVDPITRRFLSEVAFLAADGFLGSFGLGGIETQQVAQIIQQSAEFASAFGGPKVTKLVSKMREAGIKVTDPLIRKITTFGVKALGPKKFRSSAEGFIPNFAKGTAKNQRDRKRIDKRNAAIAAQSENIKERRNKTSAAQAKVAAVRARPVLPSRLRSGLGGSFQAKREIFERKQAERKATQATAQPIQRSILTTAQLRKNSPQEQARRNAKADFIRSGREMAKLPQVPGRYQPTMTGQMQSVSRKDIFKNLTQDRANKRRVGAKGVENTWKGGQAQSKLFQNRNGEIVGSEERNRKADSIRAGRIEKRLSAAGIKTPGGMYGSPTLPTKGIQGMGKGINGFPRTQIENRFQVERDARAARVGPTKVRRSLNNINRIRKADQQGFLNSGAQKTTARGVPSAAIPRPTIVGGSGGPPRGPGGGGPPRGPGGGGPPTGPGGGGPPNGPGGGGPPDGPDENDEKKKGKGKKMGGGMPGGGALIASMLIPAITGALVNPDESKRTNAEKITAGVADAAGVGIMTTSMLAMAGVAPGIGIAIGAVVGGFKLLNTTLKATVPSTKEQAAANDALVKKNEKSLASLDSALRSSEDVKQLRNSGGDPKKIAKAQLEFSKSLGRIGDKDVVNALTNEKDTGKREQVISDFQEKKRKETELSQSSFAIAQQANQVQTASAGFGVDDIKGLFSMGGYKETAPSFEAKDWDTFLNPIVDSLDFTKDKSGEAAIAMKRIMSGKDTDLAGFLKRFGTQLGMTSGAVMTATQTIKQLNGAYNPTSLANMAQYGAILMDNNATIAKGQSANAPVLDVNFQKVFEKATQNLQLDTDLKSYGEMTQKTANLDLEKNKLAIDQELGILSPMQAVRKSSEMQGKENNLLFEQKGMDLLNKSVNNLLSLVPQGLDVGTQESILEASRKTLTEGGDITELESLIKNSLGTAEDSKDILEKIANFSQESAQSFSKLKIDQSSSERSRVAKEQQAIERVQAQGDVNLGKNLLDKSSNEKVSRLETSIADLRDRARKAEGTQTPRGRAMAKDLNDRADAQESQLKAMKGVDNKGQLLDPIAVAKLEEAIAKLRTAAAAKGLGTTEGRKLTDQADKKALEVQQMRESAAKKETETFGVAYTQTGAGSKDLGTKERVKKENERILDLVNKFNEESGGAFQASLPDIQNALFSGDRAGAKKLISEGLARGGENTLEKKALAGEIRATGGEAGLFGSASASNEQQPPAKWESALSKMNEQALSSRVDAGLVLMRGKTVAKDTSIAEATKAKEEEQKANTDFQAFKSLKAEELKNNSAILGEGGGKDKLQDTIKNLNTSTNTRDGVVYSDTNEIKGTKDELKKALNSVMSGSFTGDDLKNLEASKAQKTPESVALIEKTVAQIRDLGLTFETTGEAGVKREKELQANVESAQKNSQAKMALASKAKTDFENFASNPTQRGVDFLTDSSKREDAKRKFRESNDPALKALADKMDESSKLEGQIKEVDNAPAQRRKLAADKVREELSAGGVQLGKNVEDALKGFETGAISMDDIANNGGLDKGLASKLMQYGGAKDKRDFVANTSEEVTQKETLQKALKENEISMVQQGVSQSSSINKTLYKDGQIAPGIVNTISNSDDRAKVEAYNRKIRERQAKEEELKGVDQSLMDTKGKEKDRTALSDKVKSKLKQDFESGKITGDEFLQKSKSLDSFASGEVGINDGSLFNVRKDLVEQAGDPNKTAQLQKESLALYQEATSLGGTGTEAGRQKISEADAKREEMRKIRETGEGKYEALNTGEGTVAGQKKRGAIIQEIDKSKNQETEMKKGLEGILGAMTGISNALQATVEANRVRDEAAAQAAADAKDPSKTPTVASNTESVVTLNVNVAMDGPLTPGQLAQATAGGRAAAADLGRSWAKGAGVPAPNAGPVMVA